MVNNNEYKEILDGAFHLWGICPFGYVENNLLDCRAKSRLPEKAKTVISVCFPYLLDDEKYSGLNISRYAAVPDYHNMVMNRLENAANALKEAYPEYEFIPFADNSPIPEVTAACRAGLGVKGKNSLLITKEYGSYVFLGEIVTDMEIEAKENYISFCLSCGKCVSACPDSAISDGIIRESCLSYITQKKGELSEKEINLIKESGCLWGCDICQTVCPMNIGAKHTDIEEFIGGASPRLDKNTDISGRAFEWRGKKVIERNLSIYED